MTGTEALVARADELVADGRALDAIDLLAEADRAQRDPDLEARLAWLRYQAFAQLDEAAGFDRWPVPVDDLDRGEPTIPIVRRDELSADALRRSILSHGCAHVPGLLDPGEVDTFVTSIETAFTVRSELSDGETKHDTAGWFKALPVRGPESRSLGRHFVSAAGGLLAADSPRLLQLLVETFRRIGLRDVVADYLGEQPVLSANKCTLRRVGTDANTDWHQDGAFLGAGIRALNIWVALSDCGVDAPGLDLVPRRFEATCETGTGGAFFDWAVGPAVVEQLAVESPVVRPAFRAGDALLFDDLFLHRTAIDPSMTRPRYAIEAWSFAPSSYPEGQVPLVW